MRHATTFAASVALILAAQACANNNVDILASGPAKIPSRIAAAPPTSNKPRLSLSATDRAKFQHFMSNKQLTEKIVYKSPDLDTAQVIDTILIAKALTLGGMVADFDFVKIPNSARERAMVVSGDVTIPGTSQWDWWADENSAEIYKSDEVVANGSFEKGLYTTKERAESIQINSSADLAKYVCVSNKSWRVDWNTLARLPFKQLADAPSTESMFRMVDGGHADLTVQSFSGTPDMSIAMSGITLYPIKGWKVPLNGSRHYVVSKKDPKGAAVFESLQRGLAVMRQTNEVARALTESGFYNVNVKNWKSVQPQ
jgi:hypothetical protein